MFRTDDKWGHAACESGTCKVEKCVEVWAPAALFPDYEIPQSDQCVPKPGHGGMEIRNVTNCEKGATFDMKLDFKRRNVYAETLTPEKKAVLVQRLVEIGSSLLLFALVIVGFGFWNAKVYHGYSVNRAD